MKQASRRKSNSSQHIPLVKIRMVREKLMKYSDVTGSAVDIIRMVYPLFNGLDREQFVTIGLDTKMRPTVINIVTIGTAESTIIHPREVFKPLILSNSGSFICLHNHPAGGLSPSDADKEITERLRKAGELLQIKLVDHIIIGNSKSNYLSFRREGLLR